MTRTALFLLGSIILGTSCGESRVDTAQVKARMAERKVYHITDAQLLAGAQALGERVARQLDSAQRTAVAGDSLATCVINTAPLIGTLEADGITATRLSWQDWHPQRDVPKVNEVLEAMRYTHDQGQAIPANLQKDGQGGYHYVEGLVAKDAACLSCHPSWKVGQEVGVFSLRYGSKPAVREASKGMKGM